MTVHKGENGKITVTPDALILERGGFNAKMSGISGPPRRIPLQAISGVRFENASRITNGYIQFCLGATEPKTLSASTAAGDPDTVIFRHKHKDAFRQLHEWLAKVAQTNHEQGIDFSSVQYDVAEPSRTERLEQRSASHKQAAERRREQMAETLGGEDTRQDIVEAAARLGSTFGGKREIKKLPEHLQSGETVRFMAQGAYDEKQGIVVLTDQRLIFLFHGFLSQAKEDFPLKSISSVSTRAGIVTGELKVHASGNHAVIKSVVKGDLEPLADAIREQISLVSQSPATTTPPEPAAPQVDVLEQIRKLGELRAAGVLTEDEFAAKKQSLLDRL